MKRTVALFAALLLSVDCTSDQESPSPDANEVPARTNSYIPKDLDDCFAQLERVLEPEQIEAIRTGTEADTIQYHFGLGMWIRNNWKLWGGSRLTKWFNAVGVMHPDDMSSIILISFWRHLNNRPIDVGQQIQYYTDDSKGDPKDPYNVALATLRGFECRADGIPDRDRLGDTISTLRNSNGLRFQRDRDEIVKMLVSCIKRTSVMDPRAANALRSLALIEFPTESALSSIRIQIKDPCTRRGLVGKGVRNRTWCTDRLADGAQSPELIVIPELGTIEKFAIGRTETKVLDYNIHCRNTGCTERTGPPGLPVTNLSLGEVSSYLAWLSDQTGRSYRLPTRAEWYHAAKTTKQTKANPNINCTVTRRDLRLGDRLVLAESGVPNPWGLYHHLGNAQEWAMDGDQLVAMGGAHTDPWRECTVDTHREHSGQGDLVTGFRVLREI
jgi:hypothetical protein|tara:strand:- start:1312 stop:2637 length:1326 start_codon:yes stop_codon:yes gene_type:complete